MNKAQEIQLAVKAAGINTTKYSAFNPIASVSDAMRIARKLEMVIRVFDSCVYAESSRFRESGMSVSTEAVYFEDHDDSEVDAMCHAIVFSAANLQRMKER